MALKARAEVQLLQALHQSKATTATASSEPSGDTNHQLQNANVAAKQQEPRAALAVRPLADRRASVKNEQEEAIALVRQLRDTVVSTKDQYGSKSGGGTRNQIQLNAVARRERHLAAQRVYAAHVQRVAEDVESALLSSADRVKDTLAALDTQLRVAVQSLTDDTVLLGSTRDDVLRLWEADLLPLCERRTRLVDAFASELDGMECSRTLRVRDALATLTSELMETAHALPPEVERMIESEAHELNAVVLSNRIVYADLVARLATADVDVLVDARLAWERGQQYWRQLRHADALNEFATRLNASEFTDPDERQAVLRAISAHQEAVHSDDRLAALQQLEDARATLTTEQATQILDRIRTAQAADDMQSRGFLAQLHAVHMKKGATAEQMRETLRLAVHGFGALAPEGELDACRSVLARLLHDSALDEFFRAAGGLRSELDAVVKRLDVALLIYDANLTPLRASLDVVLSGLPLERVMEAQGKGAERKAVQATLDKVRQASKLEILPLLPVLQRQLGVLVKLSDMDSAFTHELSDIVEQLELLVQEHAFASTDSHATPLTATESPPSRASTATGGAASFVSESTATASTGVEWSEAAAATPSVLTIDLQAVRKVQRRLGTLLYASDLAVPIQRHLAVVAEQLALQQSANAVVDRAIATQCDALLARRAQESTRFLEAIGRAMERQSARLNRQTETLAGFCLAATRCVEQSLEAVRYVDLSALDLLDALKDDDDERLAALETQYVESCARVRHAPDDAVLAREFEAAAELLRRIETEYRRFHQCARLAADRHAIAVEQQCQVARSRLCASFGLRAPTTSDAHPEALDVAVFLSAKCIEDIVSPLASLEVNNEEEGVVLGGADGSSARSENPQEGSAVVHAVATEPSRVTPRADGEKPRRGSRRHAATVRLNDTAETKLLVFCASSGLEAEEEVGTPELAAQLLRSHDSSDDDDALESPGSPVLTSRSEDAMGLSRTPASVVPALPDASLHKDGETGDDATEPLASELLELEQQQQRHAAEKVAIEFPHVEIPVSVVERLLTTLRDAFVSRIDRDSENAAAVAIATREARVAATDLQLEEQLRGHWPRLGRLGVQVQQPRLSELRSHRQRLERQLRSMNKRSQAHERELASRTERALAHAAHVRGTQLACYAQLPLQTSLAALQGLDGRSKKLLHAFENDATEHVDALQALTTAHTATLAASAHEFVRLCASQVFPDVTGTDVLSGCDYHVDEVRAVGTRVAGVEAQLRDRMAAQDERLAELVHVQTDVLALASVFRERYQHCIQALAMNDGLGQRFGLPRRTAQEQFRSDVTRCDEQAATVDTLLVALEALVVEIVDNEPSKPKPKLKLKPPTATPGDSDNVSDAVIRLLLQLRAKMYSRGRYFGLLANTSQLEPTPIAFEPSGRDWNTVAADASDRHDGLFMDHVRDVSRRCREDTCAIFQQEGRLDEFPNGAVPPSLDEYLAGLAAKAQAYMLRQELAFREQVHAFEALLGLAPARALADLQARAQAALSQESEQLVQAFETDFAALVVQKTVHAAALRPELCSPNNVWQLDELSARETARLHRAMARLQRFRAQVVRTHVLASTAFERELVAHFRWFMAILDRSVMTPADLQPITACEPVPQPKRKSLLRLRKLVRVHETGDAGREVKRTEAEMQRLTQLGETPRFPRRAWPAISPFGAPAVWLGALQTRMRAHDVEHALPHDEELAAIDAGSDVSADSGACVALLAPAHRRLVHARDAAYAAFVAFCSAQCERLVATAQERLRDEVKAAQSWDRGIAAMRE